MPEKVPQPTPTTNRKVRAATVAASISAPVSYLLVDLITQLLAATFPVDPTGTGGAISAIGVAVQLAIVAALVGFTTWRTGYKVHEEVLTPAERQAELKERANQ